LKPLNDNLSLSIDTIAAVTVVDVERLVVGNVRVVVVVVGNVVEVEVVVTVVVVVVVVVVLVSFSIATTSLINIKICNAITHATINQIQDSLTAMMNTMNTHTHTHNAPATPQTHSFTPTLLVQSPRTMF